MGAFDFYFKKNTTMLDVSRKIGTEVSK